MKKILASMIIIIELLCFCNTTIAMAIENLENAEVQQEVAENSTSMYFAQIASLKSIVSQMSSGDPNNTDFINQIKKEILTGSHVVVVKSLQFQKDTGNDRLMPFV